MTTTELNSIGLVQASALEAPPWLHEWIGPAERIKSASGALQLCIESGQSATLVTAVDRSARVGSGQAFRQRAINAYRAIRNAIDHTAAMHVVRMWNHIPGIHDPLDAECDRYMHFNSGRYAAMSDWFGGDEQIPAHVPAASGVGHGGQDLVIRALAMLEPGTPVENPQQVPAFRYSRRYGPIPPCFARATRIQTPAPRLLIAGTAAITGEQSQYLGDLNRQLELTLDNLRILIRCGLPDMASGVDPLQAMNLVRVYVARSDDIPIVRSRLRGGLFGATDERVEFHCADLCRTDLLVEIEGVASVA